MLQMMKNNFRRITDFISLMLLIDMSPVYRKLNFEPILFIVLTLVVNVNMNLLFLCS